MITKTYFVRHAISIAFVLYSLCNFAQTNNENLTFFTEDIKKLCPICKKDKSLLRKKEFRSFHSSHNLFAQGKKDSAFLMASKLIEENTIVDSTLLFALYFSKGRILNDKLLFDDAIENLNTAISYGKNIDQNHLTSIYAILGRIYLEKENYTKGIEILEDWKNKYSDDHSRNSRIVYHNLGLCYLHTQKFKKAEEYLFKSYELNKKFRDTLGLARSSMDIANLNYEQYKDDTALVYFKKGLEYAKNADNLITLKNAYFNLAIVEENNKNFDKSLNYRKAYEKINDSIWNKDKVWELAQKDKEIGIAVKEEKIKIEKSKKDQFKLLAAIFLILLIIGGFLYYKIVHQNKIIFQQKENLKELNITKDKLFSLLTHDLKTPIFILNKKLLQLQKKKKIKTVLGKKNMNLLTESYHLSKNTVLQVENTLHWILNNRNELFFRLEKLHLNTVMDQILFGYEPFIKDKKIDLRKEIDTTLFIDADINSTKMIVRNILDNAIKFSFEGGEIQIKSNTHDTTCELLIIDQGVGFSRKTHDENTSKTSSTKLGLRLSKELIKKNNGEIQIKSEEGKGTSVSMLFNLKID